MKKTLTALAVLGAFAGSAFAANVTLYGIVDYGFNYQHIDLDNGQGGTDTFSMDSGIQSGSRFGLKGVEDLGNGVQVGFVLENGFKADDGTLDQDGRLFGRESLLYVTTPYIEVGLGHTGMATGSIGRYSLIGKGSAFSTSFGGPTGSVNNYVATLGGNNDNTVALRTPTFGGFQAQLLYTFKKDGSKAYPGDKDRVESTSDSDRAISAAVTYAGGPLFGFLAVEQVNYKSTDYEDADEVAQSDYGVDDAFAVTLGGNYDFGPAKLFAEAQYFKDTKINAITFGKDHCNRIGGATVGQADGFGIQVSANIPLAGGNVLVGAGYLDGESSLEGNKAEFKRYGISAGYTYNLSKRTNLYAVTGYEWDEYTDVNNLNKTKPEAYKAVLGIRHSF